MVLLLEFSGIDTSVSQANVQLRPQLVYSIDKHPGTIVLVYMSIYRSTVLNS